MCMCVFIPWYKLYFLLCSISLWSSLHPIYRPGYISLLLFISVNSKNMSGKVIIHCEQLSACCLKQSNTLQHMVFAYNFISWLLWKVDEWFACFTAFIGILLVGVVQTGTALSRQSANLFPVGDKFVLFQMDLRSVLGMSLLQVLSVTTQSFDLI